MELKHTGIRNASCFFVILEYLVGFAGLMAMVSMTERTAEMESIRTNLPWREQNNMV